MKKTSKKILKAVVISGVAVGIVALLKKMCDKKPAYEDDFEDEFEDQDSIYAEDDLCEENCSCKYDETNDQDEIKTDKVATESKTE